MNQFKPPRIPMTRDNPKMGKPVSEDEIRILRERFGIKCKDYDHDDHGSSGWMNLSKDVETHTDGFGMCFVYCGSGSGVLIKNGRRTRLLEGQYTTFNDMLPHGFDLVSKSCKLLVVSISRGIPEQYKDSNYVK